MSLSGRLQDIGVADIVQFIRMGDRTGTLAVHCLKESGSIAFRRGRIASAQAPEVPKIGEILLLLGALIKEDLEQALRRQDEEAPRRPLGKILLESDLVDTDMLRQAVTQQIQTAVSVLIGWKRGTFEFISDEIHPIDDLEVFPGEVLPNLNLDPQMVLLEALKTLDEEAKDAPAEEDEDPTTGTEDDAFDVWTRGSDEPTKSEAPSPSLQLIGSDTALLMKLRRRLSDLTGRAVRVGIREAGFAAPGEPPPVVLVDLRRSFGLEIREVGALGVRRPRASLIAVIDQTTGTEEAYKAGALAAVPADEEALAAAVTNVVRNRGDLWAPQVVAEKVRSGYAKLRRVYSDLRSGLLSTTLALNLMSVLSESVDRAILFVVKNDTLVALGAFGDGPKGRLAQSVHGLTLPLASVGSFTEALDAGSSYVAGYDEAALPPELHDLLGRPCSGQCAVFPVLGAKRIIALIYADNGQRPDAIEELDVLELATAQLGVAFENELLRRQVEDLRKQIASSSQPDTADTGTRRYGLGGGQARFYGTYHEGSTHE